MSRPNLPELPGFYYDHERKRYFRIMNTGQATSQTSGDYSISAIAEVRRRRKRKIIDSGSGNYGQNQSNSSSSASSYPYSYPHPYGIGNNSLKRHLLTCSLGPRVNRFVQNATLISAMTKKAHWSLEMSSSSDSLACFAWCQKEKILIMGTKYGKCSVTPGLEMSTQPSLLITPSAPTGDLFYYPLSSFNSEVSSLSLSGNTIVHTCLGGPGTTGALGCTIMKPCVDRSIVYKLPERQSAFCSAIREDSSGPNTRIAVGANSCAYCIQPNISGFYKEPFQTGSDVLAVEFLGNSNSDPSGNNYLLSAGCRSGSLNVFDPRLPARHMTPTSPVIQAYHSSAITHIKSLQDSRYVLVSGLEDTLGLYDLRFVKSTISGKGHSPYLKTRPTKSVSTPVITYNGYSNLHTIRHGLAVDSACKNFAIASDNSKINIYNIWTGSNITGNELKDHQFSTDISAVSSLQWTSTGGLFVGFGRTLEYWSWSSFEDELEVV